MWQAKYKLSYIRVAAALVGAISGYAYYYYIGCVSGTCPITSNPWLTIVYGGLLGTLLVPKKSKKEPQDIKVKINDEK